MSSSESEGEIKQGQNSLAVTFILVARRIIPYTTDFVTWCGLQWDKKNVPSTFQLTMDAVPLAVKWKVAPVYHDDIGVFSSFEA